MSFYEDLVKKAQEEINSGGDATAQASANDNSQPGKDTSMSDSTQLVQSIKSLISEIDATISTLTQGGVAQQQPAQVGMAQQQPQVQGVDPAMAQQPASKTIQITVPTEAQVKVAEKKASNIVKFAGLMNAMSVLYGGA